MIDKKNKTMSHIWQKKKSDNFLNFSRPFEQNKFGHVIISGFTRGKELDRRIVNKAQSANQNKGLNNDVQNACELLIIEILQNLFRLNQA